MTRKVFDTNVLISFWRRKRAETTIELTAIIVTAWAAELISLYDTNRIVTPVEIEFIAGATSAQDLKLYRAFLDQFVAIDGESIPSIDWQRARQLAMRVPRDGRPRHLPDCVIRAIADRLKHDVITADGGFPHRGR